MEAFESRILLATTPIPLEVEPNNSVDAPHLLRGGGLLQVRGHLAASPDLDYYSFYAEAGANLRLNVRAAVLTGEYDEFDPIVGLFNPAGNKVADDDDNGTGSVWAAGLSYTADMSGFWVVGVTNYPDFEFSGNQDGGPGLDSGAYHLTISGASDISMTITAQYDNHGTPDDKIFGTYLPGVDLLNTFTVDLGNNAPADLVVQYRLAGGAFKDATHVNGKWEFNEQMGALPVGQHDFNVRVRHQNETLTVKNVTGGGRFDGSVVIADNLPYELQFDYGDGWIDADKVRLIDSISEGNWAVRARLDSASLLPPYQDARIEAVFRSATDHVHATATLDPQGDGTFSINDSNAVGLLKDIVDGGADYQVFLQAATSSLAPGGSKTQFTATEPIIVSPLPKWMGTPVSSEFMTSTTVFENSKVYKIDVALNAIDQPLLPTVSGLPFGILEGAESHVRTALSITVFARPTFQPGDVTARANSWDASISILGKSILDEGGSLASDKVQVTADLDPLSFKLSEHGGITAITEEIALPVEGKLSIPIGGPLATLRVPVFGVLGLSLDAYVNLQGTFTAELQQVKAKAGIRLVNGANGLELDQEQSFVSVSPKATASLSADITGGLIITPFQFEAASLLFRGTVTLDLDGKIQANFGGASGVSFERSDIRLKLGGSLQVAAYSGEKPEQPEFRVIGDFEYQTGAHRLFGSATGTAQQEGNGLTTDDAEDAAPLSLVAGEHFGSIAAVPMSQVSAEIRPVESVLSGSPTGTLRYDLPISRQLGRIRYDLAATSSTPAPASHVHYLQVVLVGTQSEIVVQEFDLSELDFIELGDGTAISTRPQDLLIPDNLLASGEVFELEMRLFTGDLEAERIEVRVGNLRVDDRRPQLYLINSRTSSSVQQVQFGPDTGGARTATVELGNASTAWLQVQHFAVIGAGVELIGTPPRSLHLGLADFVPLQIRLTDTSRPVQALLRIWSNDPDRPVLDLPLNYDGVSPLDMTPPLITDIRLRGSEWSPWLASHSIMGESAAAHWTGIDQLEIAFDEDVKVGPSSLVIRGINRSIYHVSDFHYDSLTRTATWTIDEPIEADRLVIELWAEGPHAVADLAGNRLATASNRLQVSVDILPGDVNGDGFTNILDVLTTRSTLNVPASLYPRRDVTGDGLIDEADVAAIRAHLPAQLPLLSPRGDQLLQPLENHGIEDGAQFDYLLPRSVHGSSQSLRFELLSGPGDMTIDSTTGRITWLVPEHYSSAKYIVSVSATTTDGDYLVDVRDFELQVVERNEAPQFRLVQNWTITSGKSLSVPLRAVDVDLPANTLTYSFDGETPEGATLDPRTGLFNWQPTQVQGGRSWTIVVRVTDDGAPQLSTTATFEVLVEQFNRPPSLAPVPEQSVAHGDTLHFTIVAEDDVPPTFQLSDSAPRGAAIDPQTGLFSWTTDNVLPGRYAVRILAIDADNDALTATTTVWIDVTWPHQGPVFDVPEPIAMEVHQPLEFDLSAFDPQYRPLVFGLAEGAPEGLGLSANGVLTWIATEPGEYQFTAHVWVEDNPSLRDTRVISLIVLPDTTAPQIDVVTLAGRSVQGNHYTSYPGLWGIIFEASGQISTLTGIFTTPDLEPDEPIAIRQYLDEFGYLTLDHNFFAAIAGGEFSDGQYIVTLFASDAAGNNSQATIAFILDTVEPEVEFAVPPEFAVLEGYYYFTTLSTISVAGHSEPGINIALWIDQTVYQTTTDETGYFRLDAVQLEPNENFLEIVATDAAGNAAFDFLPVFWHAEPAGPALAGFWVNDTGVEGDNVTRNPYLRATISSFPPLSSIQLTIQGGQTFGPIEVLSHAEEIPGFEFNFYDFYVSRESLATYYGGQLPDGEYIVELTIIPETGPSSTLVREFIYDRTPPPLSAELLSTFPVDALGRSYTYQQTISVVGQTDPYATVSISTSAAWQSVVADAMGGFRFDEVTLGAGFDYISVRVEDLADNSSSVVWEVMVAPFNDLPQVQMSFRGNSYGTGFFGEPFLRSLALEGRIAYDVPLVGLSLTIAEGPNSRTFDVLDTFPFLDEFLQFRIFESYFEALLGAPLLNGVTYQITLDTIFAAGITRQTTILATRFAAPPPIEVQVGPNIYSLDAFDTLTVYSPTVPISIYISAYLGSRINNTPSSHGEFELFYNTTNFFITDPTGNVGRYSIEVTWPAPSAAPLYAELAPSQSEVPRLESPELSREAVDLAFHERALDDEARFFDIQHHDLLSAVDATFARGAMKKAKDIRFTQLANDWEVFNL